MSRPIDPMALDFLCAADPAEFARQRLGYTPDPWQVRFLTSTSPRVIALCSRQVGKTHTAAVKALHVAVYEPGSLVLMIAPSLRQSKELFSKTHAFMKQLEPVEALEEENKLSAVLRNGSRIIALPGDNSATIRGFSAPRLIIEDEAAFVKDEVHTALRPMLAASRGGQLFLMSTPRGRRGHFFDSWQNGGGSWDRISITADQCSRITPEFLQSELDALGEWRFRQEYRCEFVESEDNLFRYDLIEAALTDDVAPLFSGSELISIAGGLA